MRKEMKKKGSKTAMRMKQIAIVALILAAFVAHASAATITVTPSTATSGDFVTIEGTGFGNNDEVTLNASVTGFKIPVSGDGRYTYSLVKFNIAQENMTFSVCVRAVEDDTVIEVKRFTWTPYWRINNDSTIKLDFVFDYNETTKQSKVTRRTSMPIGVYCVVAVTGTAVAGPPPTNYVQNVTMDATLTYKITANTAGGFEEVIDTHGIPEGEYTITATSSTESAEATLTLSLCGDGNKDGNVGAYDCVCIARYATDIPGYDNTTLNYNAMDVDPNPGVDIRDARYLARYLVGLETDLHCPE